MDTSKPATIKLPNGQEVLDLLNMQSTGQGALVNLNVLKRLAALLPSVDYTTIRDNFIEKAMAINPRIQKDHAKVGTPLEQLIQLMEDEIAFHRSVNIITLIDKPEQEEQQP